MGLHRNQEQMRYIDFGKSALSKICELLIQRWQEMLIIKMDCLSLPTGQMKFLITYQMSVDELNILAIETVKSVDEIDEVRCSNEVVA